MRLPLILTALMVAAAAMTGAVPARAADAPAAPQGAATAPTVTAAVAEMADVEARVPLSGTLVARQIVQVYPQVSGFEIVALGAEAGDRVEKGAVLVELDSRAEAADLKAADATLAEAQAAFDRQQSLNRSGSASDAAYQTARAALLRAQAERDRALVALEDRSLRAPFAGVIGLTKSLGKELAKTGIAVNCITPTTAKTPILDQLTPEFIEYMRVRIPRDRFVELTEIAAMVAWLLSEENSFTTAAVFDLSGGRTTY